MASIQVQFGVMDKSGDRGWTGASFIGTAPDSAALLVQQTNYEAIIDGKIDTIKVTDVTHFGVDPDTLTGNNVEYTGVVVLQDPATLKKYPYEFKSISDDAVVKNGLGSQPKCADVAVAAAKSNIAALIGVSADTLRVIRNYVAVQRS